MKKILIAVAALVVLGALYLSFDKPGQEAVRNYESDEYGFSFNYPDGYELSQANPAPDEFSITLIQKENTKLPENGETPPFIDVRVYDKTSIALSPLEFVQNDQSYQGVHETLSVDGKTAYGYRWDGLYPGRTVVFEHKNTIIVISGTYLDPEDKIKTDFDKVVSSFELED